jgi:diguanylate cyclase
MGAASSDDLRAAERRFVHRIHRIRALGLALGAVAVGAVLHHHDAASAWWVLLAVNGFVWPHAAAWLACRSDRPREAELRNLVVDSAFGGLWVAVMEVNLLPSALLVAMLAADKVAVGGPRLLARAFAAQAIVFSVVWAMLGFPFDSPTPGSVMLACVPLLVVYPVAISGVTYALSRRVVRQNRHLESLGRIDALTGLANRRQGFAIAEAELARHCRTGRPAALLMLDIDRFKAVNDQHGHLAGDEVLRGVADALRGTCRTIDTPARYGGDEFLVVLPETDLAGAAEAASRVRAAIASLSFGLAPGFACTVSVGAAQAGGDDTSVGTWIQQADAALYRAKNAGRDRFAA